MPGTHAATTGPEGDKNVAQRELYDQKFRLGVYGHYKGGVYIAYSITAAEDTLEPLVHYYSCEKKTRWTRTMKNFTERVEVDDPDCPKPVKRPRFEYRYPATWQQLAEAAGLDELVKGLQAMAEAQDFVRHIRR